MKPKIVALIPLRGGSKEIVDKNIAPIAARPLCAWVLEATAGAESVDQVYVSTDSDRIAAVVTSLGLGIEIIKRPAELATDQASTESVMEHFASLVPFDLLITLQATSPLTSSADIEKGLALFTQGQYDSLLTAVRVKNFFWDDDHRPINYNPLQRPRRQDFAGSLVENGAFYITKSQILKKHKCRLGGRIGIYEMALEQATDLDTQADFITLEAELLKRQRGRISEIMQNIRLVAIDVDGTLTDAGMYYSAQGEELKKFNTKDAFGISLLRGLGIKIALITKEDSEIVKARARKLKIELCYTGIEDKLTCLKEICEQEGIALAQVAFIGDDLNDLEAICATGFSACPEDAAKQVRAKVTYIAAAKGGAGAVRDICEYMIEALC